MIKNFDFYDPHGMTAVIYTQAARQGRRIEIGVQVFNPASQCWQKCIVTQLLAGDVPGIAFELQRLYDKAIAAGYRCVRYAGKEIAS